MPRSVEEITRPVLKRLAAMVGQSEVEVGDTHCTGLCVRVRKTDAAWTLRGRLVGKQSTWRIESIASLSDPKVARDRANEAKRLLARGINPADWLREQEARGPVIRTGNKGKDGWLWPDAVTAFLDAKARNRSQVTVRDYRNALNAPDLRGKFDDRPMKSITTRDIRALVERIDRTGKTAQANHILRVVKSLFAWCTQQEMSGIADTPSIASIVAPRDHRQELGHVPTQAELGLLFWRLDEADLLPQARLAAALLALTAQRRDTIITAKSADFSALPDKAGWGMWRMEADPLLHIDRAHALPLPPLAWGIVTAARQLAGTSPWLFPQVRRAKASDAKTTHMSGNMVGDAFKAGSDGTVTPHDMRRALATHGPALLGIKDADIKKVLNHAPGRDVTSRHYAFHESIPDKSSVLEQWQNWLVGLMEARAPDGQSWPGFLPQPPSPS